MVYGFEICTTLLVSKTNLKKGMRFSLLRKLVDLQCIMSRTPEIFYIFVTQISTGRRQLGLHRAKHARCKTEYHKIMSAVTKVDQYLNEKSSFVCDRFRMATSLRTSPECC